MSKYKNYKKACANPLLVHKKPIIVGLRPFTSEMKSKFDSETNVEKEEYVCINCVKRINKLQPINILKRSSSAISCSSSCSSELTVQSIEQYSCSDETNETLQSLFVSPIKTCK